MIYFTAVLFLFFPVLTEVNKWKLCSEGAGEVRRLGLHLRKPQPANPADLFVSLRVYSAARGLDAGSGLITAPPRPQPPRSLPPPHHLRWSHRMPSPPSNPRLLLAAALLQQTARPTCVLLLYAALHQHAPRPGLLQTAVRLVSTRCTWEDHSRRLLTTRGNASVKRLWLTKTISEELSCTGSHEPKGVNIFYTNCRRRGAKAKINRRSKAAAAIVVTMVTTHLCLSIPDCRGNERRSETDWKVQTITAWKLRDRKWSSEPQQTDGHMSIGHHVVMCLMLD